MSVLLAEYTREQIRELAPIAVAVLPTASIEQHGPHLPILTDTILCGTVSERAAALAAASSQMLVAPVLCYGRSHHHRPFPGVLSLSTETYMRAVTDILEGLFLSGFRKIVVLNGHGGNTDANAIVCADFIQNSSHDLSIAYASYWDIARDAIVAEGIMPGARVPGHAGRFEASMVMAIRPDLVNEAGLKLAASQSADAINVAASLAGGTVHSHGEWAASRGYTDEPHRANAEDGKVMLAITVRKVADFLTAFANA